jgi:hypothetical protein
MPSDLLQKGLVLPKVWAARGRVTKLRLQLLDPRNPQVSIAYSFTDPARVPAQVKDILTLPPELCGIDHAMLRLSETLTNQVATYMDTPYLWDTVSYLLRPSSSPSSVHLTLNVRYRPVKTMVLEAKLGYGRNGRDEEYYRHCCGWYVPPRLSLRWLLV